MNAMDLTKFEFQIFFSTVRITIPSADGMSHSIGTGFLFDFPLRQDGKVGLFLVSNKHVFGDPHQTIILNLHRCKEGADEPNLGHVVPIVIQDFSEYYYGHPNDEVDLACINVSAYLGTENGVYSRNLHGEFIEPIDFSRLLPGSEVLFIGYPDNRFDTAHNLPILRKGFLATLPSVDFNNLKQVLIDAQVFPGSSGSPVFVVMDGQYRLLGVVTQTMVKDEKLKAMAVEYSLGIQQTIGLGIVLKTELVIELLQVAKDGLSNRIDRVSTMQP